MTYRYYLYGGKTPVRLVIDDDGLPDDAEIWRDGRFEKASQLVPNLMMGSDAIEVSEDRFHEALR